ncbi:glycerophosphodiester phosphodiesterase family protein [Jiulongibacter sediminis]|uniref:Glycerophosphodiester phosphodiesterase n=1 Tax=Jiulongibacter sediminis TaxID=1605367 RepID=A0A0P7C8V6_9BACT|nr:glycerophosphodiester phosphodiesterase family protein [Jiulongibacter sediminis]KPM50183.1 glycerophosphodiester phosphodiesterase [Jiulongibacter sediminis]TBX27203.1 glycerophosphodiester phosphodiesterase [Jiulongibacter sediminis]
MAQSTDFEIQGHRGSRGLMPENTIPAFIRAIDEGVQTLELDVVISKDKKVVVSHDPFFNPEISTGPDGIPLTEETQNNLYQLTYKEIKQFDVGLRGNPNFPEQQKMAVHKPLLKKMIKKAEKYAKKKGVAPLNYNIELKSLPEEYNKSQPEVDEFSDLVHDVIFQLIPSERVTIQSFDFNVLRYWFSRIQAGEYEKPALSALIEPYDDNDIDLNLNKLGFKPDVWSPYFLHLNEEKVEKLHQLGIKVIPWTVNKIKDMKSVKAIGCDGLITDYPNRARNL